MLYFILFILIVIIIVGIVKFSLAKSTPHISLEEKPDYPQGQAQPGQNFVQATFTKAQLERDKKIQEVANQATIAAREGIEETGKAVGAILEKEALPERHEQTLAKEEAETQTFIAVQEAVQGEANLRKELAGVASERLLTIEDMSAVNKHGYLKEIDLKARQVEIQQDLDAADRYELTQHELINKLTTQLQQLVKERRRIELEEDDEYVKQRLLDRHDKNISVVEQLIDGRQTRLLLSENGQGNQSSEAEDTDSGTDRKEAPETDN